MIVLLSTHSYSNIIAVLYGVTHSDRTLVIDGLDLCAVVMVLSSELPVSLVCECKPIVLL
jgi:hypothetical protein